MDGHDFRTIALVAGEFLEHPERRALRNFGVTEEAELPNVEE